MAAGCAVQSPTLAVWTVGSGGVVDACFADDCSEVPAFGKMISLLLVLSKPRVLLLLM